MANRWYQLVVDAQDPVRLGNWWARVLGYAVLHETEHEVIIGTSAQRYPGIVFIPVDDAKAVKNRGQAEKPPSALISCPLIHDPSAPTRKAITAPTPVTRATGRRTSPESAIAGQIMRDRQSPKAHLKPVSAKLGRRSGAVQRSAMRCSSPVISCSTPKSSVRRGSVSPW